MSSSYARSVFINCPFTPDYVPLFRALVFAVVDCGYSPRCASEYVDSGQVRLQKIETLIESCKFGIHDLSNMDLDSTTGLPRFNMPFELGLFLGAKRFGEKTQTQKRSLILDEQSFRYQKALSDISGQDIKSHNGEPAEAIRCIREWLQTVSRRTALPGAKFIIGRYTRYERDLPAICAQLQYDADALTFLDLWQTMVTWQKEAADRDQNDS